MGWGDRGGGGGRVRVDGVRSWERLEEEVVLVRLERKR